MTITPLWKAGAELGMMGEFSFVSNVVATTTQKKTGAYAFMLEGVASSALRVNEAATQARVGMYVVPRSNVEDLEAEYFSIYEGNTPLVRVYLGTYGTEFLLSINDVVEVRIPTPFAFGQWIHLGVDLKQDGWVRVYLDGVLTMSHAGNFLGTPATYRFMAAAEWEGVWVVDDLYIDGTPGEAAPAPPPDKRFVWMPFTADVEGDKFWTPSTGTDHFALVDEIPPSEADLLSTAAAGTVDTFIVSAPTLPTGYIPAAVWPTVVARKSAANVATQLTLRVRDKPQDISIDGASQNLPTTAGVITGRVPTQPDGLAWHAAALVAMHYGFVSSGTF